MMMNRNQSSGCAIWNSSEKINLFFLKVSIIAEYSYIFDVVASSSNYLFDFIKA
jgi:hypothetical protein